MVRIFIEFKNIRLYFFIDLFIHMQLHIFYLHVCIYNIYVV